MELDRPHYPRVGARNDVPKPHDSGSSGPEDALMLLHRDGRNGE